MGDEEFLAERFEANRSHLRAVAYRMLGSASEADDAVQEAWIRLSRSDTTDVENLARLAHDRHRPGVPRHAALAHVTA
jgi:RNA polymerase sigma-70 factor (ECF subfamily)